MLPILPSPDALIKLQQKEIEAQLHFLKARHLELMKQQQPKPGSSSRCEECNINFSKHQNYVAHKKYYCAANASKGPPPPAPFQIVSDNEEDSDQPHSPSSRKKTEKKSQVAKAALPHVSPQNPQPNMAAMAAALLGLDPKSKEAAMLLMKSGMSKEMLEAAGKPPPPMPSPQLLAAVTAATAATSPGPSASTPPPTAATLSSMLAHFVCEGCGIKFKSVSNLQAHQARYCAGLRKLNQEAAAAAAVAAAAGESTTGGGNPFEAMLKKLLQQQQQQQQVLPAATVAEAFLSQKSPAESANNNKDGVTSPSSKEDYCCKLCGLKESSKERIKDHINMHFIGHIKRKSSETVTGEDDEAKKPRLLLSPGPKSPTKDDEAKENKLTTDVMKCMSCDIGFSQLSNFLAHKKYYCRGLQTKSPTAGGEPSKAPPSPSQKSIEIKVAL